MNATSSGIAAPVTTVPVVRPLHAGYFVVAGVFAVAWLSVIGITGYFRLGPETEALRQSCVSTVGGKWHKKIAINVGWFTTALVRAGSGCFNLPAEPRAALAAVRAAEVGVYDLEGRLGRVESDRVFARADKAMAGHGWERMVGVAKEHELVAIYIPRRGLSVSRVRCSLLVLHDRELVVLGARGNPQPLLELAAGKSPELGQLLHHPRQRKGGGAEQAHAQ